MERLFCFVRPLPTPDRVFHLGNGKRLPDRGGQICYWLLPYYIIFASSIFACGMVLAYETFSTSHKYTLSPHRFTFLPVGVNSGRHISLLSSASCCCISCLPDTCHICGTNQLSGQRRSDCQCTCSNKHIPASSLTCQHPICHISYYGRAGHRLHLCDWGHYFHRYLFSPFCGYPCSNLSQQFRLQ